MVYTTWENTIHDGSQLQEGEDVELRREDPLYQQIYRILRQQIVYGHFKAGESLSESRIAQSFNVSRTPVREALQKLASERLVVLRGFELTVVNPTHEEFVELYACRTALEQVVAEKSAELAVPADIANMHEALAEARTAIDKGDHARVFKANTQFHDHMVASTRMPLLAELLDSIRGQILIARRHVLAESIEIENGIFQEHMDLMRAIEAHQPTNAKMLMARHMQDDLERGLKNFPSK